MLAEAAAGNGEPLRQVVVFSRQRHGDLFCRLEIGRRHRGRKKCLESTPAFIEIRAVEFTGRPRSRFHIVMVKLHHFCYACS